MKLRQVTEPTPKCPNCRQKLNLKNVAGFGTKYSCVNCGAEYIQELEFLNPFTGNPIKRYFIRPKTEKRKKK